MTPAPCPPPRADAATPEYDWDGYGFWTREVHAGEYPDRNAGLRVPPLALSAGYVFADFDDGAARFAHTADGRIYSRQGNPTNAVAERRLASLEGGSEAVLTSSGQAAITAALLTLAGSGDHIVSAASIYGGTRTLFGRSFRRFGVDVDYVWNTADDAEWAARIRPTTRAIYCETIPNPLNDITDLRRIARVARDHGLPLVVDNTVGTPALIRPVELGAHIVVHSTTKFLSGHGTAVGGAVVDLGTFDWQRSRRPYPLLTEADAGCRSVLDRCGPRTAYATAVREAVVNDVGFAVSPLTGFLLHQGLETLSLRMARHTRTAERLAGWLGEQPEVVAVHYAGLATSPLAALARRDYPAGTGSVFGVRVAGGLEGARRFFDGVRVWSRMTGIGDTRSMLLHPRTSTHAGFSPELNARLGITEDLIRLSVGLESPEDLERDLRAALDQISRP